MSDEANQDRNAGPTAHRPSLITHHFSRVTSLACSCAALAIAFFGLLQLDLPVTRYVRSVTVHLPWDQLTVPWMAFTSNAGDWIGQGWHLIGASAALLLLGWGLSSPYVVRTGIDTLIAHGLAALLSNGLKHLIGRPRPKFVHSGEWQIAPSWTSGLDSFPSGHTTATFAVATVVARRFPVAAPIVMTIAAFVGVSRVLRGSHFTTDVFAGAVLGLVSGSLAAAPWKEWRTSLQEGVLHAGIGVVSAFSLLWILSHPAQDGLAETVFMGFGVLALVAGVWMRVKTWMRSDEGRARQGTLSLPLTAYGLACLTASPLIVSSVGLMCLAAWLYEWTRQNGRPPVSWRVKAVREGALALGVLLVLMILLAGRGSLPFR
jgi:undecaprenyl-diphosphatase